MPKVLRGRLVHSLPEADLTGLATEPHSLGCSACEQGVLLHDLVRSAFWVGEGLVVIEDIPAFVCDRCGERFFDDETAMRLDLMRGRGFPASHVVHTMTVPVFHFEAAAPERGRPKDER